MAFRSASRAERVEDFVRALELHVNRHPLVRQHAGLMVASGQYKVRAPRAAAARRRCPVP